jgi:uncharacterized protein (DUF2267 family)
MNLENYYENVQKNGFLRTPDHAKRWSDAILKLTGHNLKRGTRKALAKALPKELGGEITRLFWLVNLHEPELPAYEFQRRVARRAGVTDAQFALNPIKAVYAEVKKIIDKDLSNQVKESLPTAVAEIWEKA